MTDDHQRRLLAANIARAYRHVLILHSRLIADAISEKTAIPRKREIIYVLLRKKNAVKAVHTPLPHTIAVYFYRLKEAENALKTGFFRRRTPDLYRCQEKLYHALQKLHIILEKDAFIEEIKNTLHHKN